MHLTKLLVYFETSPAIRLLRSPNAPYILDFLYQQFKRAGHITIPLSDLSPALIAYREDIQETHPDALRDKPETYLTDWCSSEIRLLQRFFETGRNEAVYQLTPHSEDVLAFLDKVLEKDLGFIGTESRLRLIIETLSDLVIGASDDPVTRLTHLRKEKQRLEDEIQNIESAGLVTKYQPAQIRERFSTAVSLLKQLQGDFRAVEEKFKEITQQVHQRQTIGDNTRGDILEFALDSEDVLKQEDQGVSFYEFVRFILSPSQQERFQTIIQQLAYIQELAEQAEGLETVRRMVPLLLAEAKKVMRTNQRLSATLRRLLDLRTQQERQRVAQLLGDIIGFASSLAADPPRDTVSIEIESKAEISLLFSRTFWNEPPQFTALDLVKYEGDELRRAEAFKALAQLHRLDWRGMRRRIASTVSNLGTVTLCNLLKKHPLENGIIEVLGYVQIARDDGHIINRDAFEKIVVPSRRPTERPKYITVPLITFIPTRGNAYAK